MRTSQVTPDDVGVIKHALHRGYYQHDIAAYYGINQGRVSEIKNKKRWIAIQPAETLPDDFLPFA